MTIPIEKCGKLNYDLQRKLAAMDDEGLVNYSKIHVSTDSKELISELTARIELTIDDRVNSYV